MIVLEFKTAWEKASLPTVEASVKRHNGEELKPMDDRRKSVREEACVDEGRTTPSNVHADLSVVSHFIHSQEKPVRSIL